METAEASDANTSLSSEKPPLVDLTFTLEGIKTKITLYLNLNALFIHA